MRDLIHLQLQSSNDPKQARQKLRELENTHPELALQRQVEEIQEKALQVLVGGSPPLRSKSSSRNSRPPSPWPAPWPGCSAC